MAFSSFPAIYLDHPNLQQFQQQQQQQLQVSHQHGSGVEGGQIHLQQPSQQQSATAVEGLTPPGGGGGSLIRPGSMVDRARMAKLPVPEAGLKCPRCDSSNTKFCYFNNYNLSQPRHFCKTCRRYWTRGGALRNVPVGGGCRRNKKSKSGGGSKTAANSANSSGGNTAPCGGPSSSNTDMSMSMGMSMSSGFPNLPLMSAIQNLNHYAVGPTGGSNLGGFPANMGFSLGRNFLPSGGGENDHLSAAAGGGGGGVEQWRLPPIGGYEQLSNNLFHFQGEGIDTATPPGIGDQHLGSPADVKPAEETPAASLRKQFHINPSDHTSQFWSGNPWTGFSGHTSSSSSHLL